MKKRNFIIFSASLGLLMGCYKDKGNYDYKDINAMNVTMLPEASSYNEELYTYYYVYRQPAVDTLAVKYTADVEQTLIKDDANIQYEWIVRKTGQNRSDTIRTKDLTLKLAPKVASAYQVVFRAIDKQNEVSVYRQLSIKTELPFVKSWFVLHGEAGDRSLGTVEYPDKGLEAEVLMDAYNTVHGLGNPFKNANDLLYLAADGSDFRAPEHLTVLEANKAYYMHAFDLVISARGYNLMVPDPAERLRLAYGVTNNALGRYAIIVTENKKFIHGGVNGFYHKPIVEGDYSVDKAYISAGSYLLTWDNSRKRFMYYNFGDNWYTWYDGMDRPTGVANNAILTPFPEMLFAQNELATKDVLWMGTTIETGVESGSAVIAKDAVSGQYWLYNVRTGEDASSGGKDGAAVAVSKQLLANLNLDSKSLFATSAIFDQQFFFTSGNSLYHYNTVTEDLTQIYTIDPGMQFSQLKFRESEAHYNLTNENLKLGIAVQSADGKIGQLHEITFNQSGDVVETVKFKGDFGPIKDLDFSLIHRIIR